MREGCARARDCYRPGKLCRSIGRAAGVLGRQGTGCPARGSDEPWRLLLNAHDIRQKTDFGESGALQGPLPLPGREEAAARSVERVEPRRSERLGQVEDE